MTKVDKRKQVCIDRNTTHNMSKRSEYSNWKDMLKRCFNPKNKRYADYAERGISVHQDFVESFPKWLEEIGPKPEGRGWSVGRINNNEWYTYGNIRWETPEQQARNHTKQKNNTSGIVGVRRNTKTVAGKQYSSWIASWSDGVKKISKEFSTNKFGEDTAKQMAIDYRNKMIEELNLQGFGYANSHGSEKEIYGTKT